MYNPFPADPSRRGRGPTPDTPSNEPEPPLPLRLRVRKWRQNAGATLAGVPRALPLVWKSHRGYTVGMAIFSVLFGILPTATAWVSKLLIDSVVAAVENGGRQDFVDNVIWLVVLQFGLFIGTALLQTVRNINQQALQEL